MTLVKETRHIFSLDDIRHVRIICVKCCGEMARPLSQSSNVLPEKCPNCLEEWWDIHRRSRAIEATTETLKAINRLMKILEVDAPPITVRFEIDAGSEEKTG